jgi:auxin response factor
MTQFMAEGNRSENHIMWHPKQTDINSNNNSNSISRPQIDGSWLSSPRTCVTQHLFQDMVDDSKSVSAWAALPSYSTPHLSKLENDSFPDPVEKAKKADTATSYRLFGFDLINHPTSSPKVEKANAQPISVSNGSTERHVSTLTSTDSDHKSDLSRDSKDMQVGQMQVPPKEIQSRQNCFASTRSRTKVLNEKYFET